MSMHPHRPARWYLLAFFVLAADQAAKTFIHATRPLGWSAEVTPFFNLVHVLNPGAAFSFLAGAGGWQRWLFLGVAIAASAWLIWMLREPRQRVESLSFSLVLGGALGNAVDRVIRGQVVDYLDFHAAGWHWPAFNLADVGITVGAACLVLSSIGSGAQSRSEQKA